MKKLNIAAMAIIAISQTAQPSVPETGDGISFSTGLTLTDTGDYLSATSFTAFWNPIGISNSYGIYLDLFDGDLTLNPFSFGPSTGVQEIWSIVNDGVTYSFEATSMEATFRAPFAILIEGEGIAKITGQPDAIGTFTMASNSNGSDIETIRHEVVPDGTSSAILMMIGLVGIAVALRRGQ